MSNPHSFEDIREMIKNLPEGSRLLGLDVGTKTIGLAISDSNFKVAMAIDTIRRTKFTKDIKYLSEIIEDRSIGGLVIGLPISMDGTEGSACQSIRQFGSNVIDQIQIGITFWDERLSTIAVQRFLTSEADMTRKRRAKVVDKLAATYILQGAIDSI
jgi:putative Holliday junction resolvase